MVFLLAALVSVAGCGDRGAVSETQPELTLATTTSTYDSGLLDEVLPVFEEKYGYKVHVVSVGTGAALETGRRGDCDVLLVHAKEQELALVEEGHFVDRYDVMYNDFVVVGPEADPAGVASVQDVKAAFAKIAEEETVFVSRGDDSGTHKAELKIWEKAGIQPQGDWYHSVGQGMGDTLRMAGEMRGYALTDRGTWIAMRDSLDLEVVLEGDPVLFNQYGVMAVNPDNHPHIDYDGAGKFIDFFISDEGQELIAGFKKHGEQLFVPNASS
ncbi:MAG: substrate-binding domain-containing protein [Candidatus Desulforudis sp.]|nr:substrate-binding domain-containing protein [Desulforudis sp.]